MEIRCSMFFSFNSSGHLQVFSALFFWAGPFSFRKLFLSFYILKLSFWLWKDLIQAFSLLENKYNALLRPYLSASFLISKKFSYICERVVRNSLIRSLYFLIITTIKKMNFLNFFCAYIKNEYFNSFPW